MFKNNALQVLKGVVISCVISIFSVLIFAFVLRQFYLPNNCIKPVNYIIKIVAILVGCFFAINYPNSLIKGGIIGLFSSITIHLIFFIISSKITFNLSFFIDTVCGIIIGVISGVIANLIKK